MTARRSTLLNLDDISRGSTQLTTNIPGYEGDYKTLEFSANKRYGNRWSLNASYSYVWTQEYNRTYFNQTFGTAVSNFSLFGAYPTNPNEKTLNEFTNWNAKFSGTVDAGWGMRHHAGAEDAGRRALRPGLSRRNPNYNTAQLILVEPIGTRRQDTVTRVRHPRREAAAVRGQGPRRPVLFDLYNLMNANTNININWRSGLSLRRRPPC